MKHLCVSHSQGTQSNELNHNELGVLRPYYIENFIMMSCIRPVQIKRGELAYEVVRCLPDLNLRFVCDSNERSIRRKLDCIDRLLEIEMVKDNTPTEVNEESPPICAIKA